MEKIYKADVTLLGKIISAEVSLMPAGGSGGTSDHSQLSNLGFENSGHTGFEPVRTDNQNYVTDAELIDITKIPDKVDKVTGKGLSTNDYTDSDKNRLADTSGENTGDQDLSGLAIDTEVFHKYIGDEIAQLYQKAEIVNDDVILLEDSENEFTKVKTTLQKIRDFFKTDYDAVYELKSNKKTTLAENSDEFYPTQKAVKTEITNTLGDILTILQSI